MVDHLTKQYKTLAIFLLGTAITVQFLVVQVLCKSQYAAFFINGPIGFMLSNSFIYGCIASLPLYLFEKKAWKHANPKIDLDGQWEYEVKYYKPTTKHLTKKAQHKLIELLNHIQNNHGKVRITQTPFEICFQEGSGSISGENNSSCHATWKGISANVSKEGQVLVHFQSNLGGIRFEGIDDLMISERTNKGRPIEMKGHFRMITEGANVVLAGEVKYLRFIKTIKTSAESVKNVQYC